MCPVCTVTVIAGLGISRALGVDDTVISVWIGGLILSLSFWLISWMGKRRWFEKIKPDAKKYINGATFILMYLLTLVPLYFTHTIGIKRNTLLGIDKIILGTIAGSAVFLIGIWADKKVRKIRGKQFFKFQKVVFPVLALIISSLVFFFVTKY